MRMPDADQPRPFRPPASATSSSATSSRRSRCPTRNWPKQARKLLERPSSLDIPLVKGPFVSLSEAFAKGEPVQAMADRGTAPPDHAGPDRLPDACGCTSSRCFEAVKEGRHVLVATGTGSGKTESFLYPIVDDLLRQRDRGVDEGLTAILVYPMNALANDQLDRLRDMLGGTGHHLRPVGRHDPGEGGRCRRGPVRGLRPPGVPGRPPAAPGGGPGRGPGRAPPGPARGVLLRGGHPRAQAPHPADQLPPAGSPDHPAAGRGPVRRGPAQVPRLRRGPHLRRGHRGRGRLPDPPGAGAGREDRRRDHLHRHLGHPLRPDRRARTTTRRPAASPPASSASIRTR